MVKKFLMQILNQEKDFVSLIKRMMNGNFNLDELLKEQITNSKLQISKKISKKNVVIRKKEHHLQTLDDLDTIRSANSFTPTPSG